MQVGPAKRAGLRRRGISGLTRARSGGKFGGRNGCLKTYSPSRASLQKPGTPERIVCQIGEERFAIECTVTELPPRPSPVMAFPSRPRYQTIPRRPGIRDLEVPREKTRIPPRRPFESGRQLSTGPSHRHAYNFTLKCFGAARPRPDRDGRAGGWGFARIERLGQQGPLTDRQQIPGRNIHSVRIRDGHFPPVVGAGLGIDTVT